MEAPRTIEAVKLPEKPERVRQLSIKTTEEYAFRVQVEMPNGKLSVYFIGPDAEAEAGRFERGLFLRRIASPAEPVTETSLSPAEVKAEEAEPKQEGES